MKCFAVALTISWAGIGARSEFGHDLLKATRGDKAAAIKSHETAHED